MKKLTLLLLFLIGTGAHEICGQELVPIRGKVIDDQTNEPLPGVAISVKGTQRGIVSDAQGEFQLKLSEGNQGLIFRFLGYVVLDQEIRIPLSAPLLIRLVPTDLGLASVEVVATGYQEVPKTRATGSFVQIGEELKNRRVSTNLLDRLEDVTPGLVFNRTGDAGRDPISIRGRSTLGRFNQPLIVVDNFPYDGTLEDLNPNDVESITVLRDAAAASIWGARAGNGVIVVTTKSGKANQPVKVSWNSNVNRIEAVDPFLPQVISVTDYIHLEQQLFASGFYNAAINNPNRPALTPVVELLLQQRSGQLTAQEAETRINALRNHDLRNDLSRYLYRSQMNQQYSLGVSGGGDSHTYRLGLGYDGLREGLQGNASERITFSLKNDFRLLRDRLTVQTGFFGTKSKGTDQNLGPEDLVFSSLAGMYPYARLADENGNPLELNRDIREGFKRTAESQGLLDWAFRPLEEFGRATTQSARTDLRLTLGANYQIGEGLKLSALYQYWENQRTSENLNQADSYFARNLINSFTQRSSAGNLSFPVPRGGIFNRSQGSALSHSARTQLDFSKALGKFNLNALGGAELKTLDSRGFTDRYYGYNSSLAASQVVDYLNPFPRFTNPNASDRIPFVESQTQLADRFYSLFATTSISYQSKYTLTGSLRRDASNLFGVRTNQQAVPLGSMGLGWTISEEGFYGLEFLPYLKLRASHGFNGNVDRSLSAFTTAQFLSFNLFIPANYAQLVNPPNQDLRWERIRISNLGLDFEDKSGRISGSVEVYKKAGLDLIGSVPFAPSTGITTFTGNNASTSTTGFDLSLMTKNTVGKIKWTTHWIASGLRERVTDFEINFPVANLLNFGISGRGGEYFPVAGKPLFAVYSLPWGGLNPDNGNPRGILEGQETEDYRGLLNNTPLEDLVYHGSARPTFFGAVRNEFSYRGFSLSVNVSYRMGYYFRKESVQYETLLQGRGGHRDFERRWMQAGDEALTFVPSMPAARNAQRDQFYRSSSVLVDRGDHIRLQDVRLAYRLGESFPWKALQGAEFYLYANNLGMIWKANRFELDPDFGELKPLRSLAIGLQIGI
jgi:TonB-dependent starch-binding outer membrane protein SusC